jgi:hypothetical protein
VNAGATSALSPRDLQLVEAIAERVIALLGEPSRSGTLVDAATLARALCVSRDCVYAHAAELGGKRLGSGPRGRLRFDLDRALSAWTARSTSKESQASQTPGAAGDSSRRRGQRLGSGHELLPIRGSVTPPDGDRARPR